MPVSLETILGEMFAREASDVYLTVGLPPVLRIRGSLVNMDSEHLTDDVVQRIAYSFLTDEQKEIFEREWELDLSFGYEGKARLRGSVYRQRGSVAATIRMIPAHIPSFEELKLPSAVESIVNLPKGLVIVSGASGSGKSTTLSTMIDYINERENIHILTAEDPIEVIHPHKKAIINQREVGQDTNTFARALKYALREDPDVVLIGEMRDLETIESTLTIAETGHLAFATLHTPDAIQAINRIIDVFPAHQQPQVRSQLSASLQAVICQQLIPMADGSGLVLAAEVLMMTGAVRSMVREEKVHQVYSVMQTGTEMGMQTMNQSLYKLFRERMISKEDAFSHSADREELEKLIRKV